MPITSITVYHKTIIFCKGFGKQQKDKIKTPLGLQAGFVWFWSIVSLHWQRRFGWWGC
jgi:hypothetical protein